jgi:hypothetical protein
MEEPWKKVFSAFRKPRSTVDDDMLKLGFALVLGHAALETCKASRIRWADHLWRLVGGVPTGSRLSPLIAAAFATDWLRQVFKRCAELNISCPEDFGRYVDDSAATYEMDGAELQKFLDVANSINESIKVTHAVGDPKGILGPPKLTHLNFRAWIGAGDHVINFQHFRKEHSGRGVPRSDSAISFKRKKDMISNEALEIYKCSSHKAYAVPALFDLKMRLAASGYDRDFVNGMINHGKGRYDGILEKAARGERSLFRDAQERREEKIEKHGPSARAHGPPGEKVTAFFDFFSDGLQRELNVIMKQGDLGMRADSRGGNTVQNIHQRRPSPHIETAPPVNPDGSHVFPGLEKSGIFKTKNAVYSITCKVPGCEHEEYTGQTGGQCGSRFKDHISDTVHGRMHSSICGHYKSKHPHLCKKLSLGANLKARGRNKALKRSTSSSTSPAST